MYLIIRYQIDSCVIHIRYIAVLHSKGFHLMQVLFFFFQDDLHIVDSLEIPTDDPQYLEDLVKERGWGISVLFVDV